MIVTLTLITGIIGTGHHYFWIGTPEYWQWWGSIFSLWSLSLLRHDRLRLQHGEPSPPRASQQGCRAVGAGHRRHGLPGRAGIWGFLHTLAPVNYYTHGTQITAAHGHMAFYGAYVMVNLTIISYAMPILRGRAANSNKVPGPGDVELLADDWWPSSSSRCSSPPPAFCRSGCSAPRHPLPFMVAQEKIALFYWMREWTGVAFLVGLLVIASFFVGGKEENRLIAGQHQAKTARKIRAVFYSWLFRKLFATHATREDGQSRGSRGSICSQKARARRLRPA